MAAFEVVLNPAFPGSPPGAPAHVLVEVFQGDNAHTVVVPFSGAVFTTASGQGPRWFADTAAPTQKKTLVSVRMQNKDVGQVWLPWDVDATKPLGGQVYCFEAWEDVDDWPGDDWPAGAGRWVTRAVGTSSLDVCTEASECPIVEWGSDEKPELAGERPVELGVFRCTRTAPSLAPLIGCGLVSGQAILPGLQAEAVRYYRDEWFPELRKLAYATRTTCPADRGHVLSPLYAIHTTMAAPGSLVGLMYSQHVYPLTFEEAWLRRQLDVARQEHGRGEGDGVDAHDLARACTVWLAARPYVHDVFVDARGGRHEGDAHSNPFVQSCNDCEDDCDAAARVFVWFSRATFKDALLREAQALAKQYVVFQCLGLAKELNTRLSSESEFGTHAYAMAVRRDVAERWVRPLGWKPRQRGKEVNQSLPAVLLLEGTVALCQRPELRQGQRALVRGFTTQLAKAAQFGQGLTQRLPVYFEVPNELGRTAPFVNTMHLTVTKLMTDWYEAMGEWTNTTRPHPDAQRICFYFAGPGARTLGQYLSEVVAHPEAQTFAPYATPWVRTGNFIQLLEYERPVHVRLDEFPQAEREAFVLELARRHGFGTRLTKEDVELVRQGRVFRLYYRERVLTGYDATGVYELAKDADRYMDLLKRVLQGWAKRVVVQRSVARVLCFYCFV